MKIAIETVVRADLDSVWAAWSNPDDIKQWNAASDDWHTTRSSVDLLEGGKFLSRMEAKDGSMGFDFEGTYTRIVPSRLIEYRMSDGRKLRSSSSNAPTASSSNRHSMQNRRTRRKCSDKAGRLSWTTSGGMWR